ncbi:MAG: hypothetical protein KF820_04120 [Candidatus Paracaedibacteraceae bacterium]|nr:hypothetical protein [Candidatus Paracaedibacteraceae bacterium]
MLRLFLIYCISLSSVSYGGIFTELHDLSEATKNGQKYADILYPGTLYADSADGKQCLDYASAFPYSFDRTTQTHIILGCGHFLMTVMKRDPHCKIYFRSNTGTIHLVNKTFNQWTDSELQSDRTISTDLALYQLESSTPCCPSVCFPESPPGESITLTTLSCGWALDLAGKQLIDTDQNPVAWSGDFSLTKGGVLSAYFKPDTLLKLSTTNYEQWFYGSISHPVPQTFLHDSGGIWFRENEGMYELWGLTSHASIVPYSMRKQIVGRATRVLSCWFLNTPYSLTVYPIQNEGRKCDYGNFLTYLHPHKTWIQRCFEYIAAPPGITAWSSS